MNPRPNGSGPHFATGVSPGVLRVLMANQERWLGFLERRVKRRDVAEEILHDAFVRSIARGGSLREDESAVAWFYRLLRNAIVDHMRGESVEQRGRLALARETGNFDGRGHGGPSQHKAVISELPVDIESVGRQLPRGPPTFAPEGWGQ
jgi:DNA-directed RNA polymerase specialized sigma24 family protein